jgi:2-polyprenyl-6-methoxyphenol hydroxylase-like FAD-dependent oxidoreductase
MKTKKILISGASVAGPALAFWLNRYGFEVTVVERAPYIRPGGYGIDFRGPAMQVLEKMDIIKEIKRFETRAGKITIVDKHNQKLASMPDGFTSGELEIMRGDLANVFYEATKADAEYIFDDTITALNEDSSGIMASFSRGQDQLFDIVVGADGLHSTVRELAFGDESQFMHHLGIYFSIFSTPNFMDLKDMAGLYYGTLGKRVGVFSARQDTEARGAFYFASPQLSYNYKDIEQQKQMIRERFVGEQWQVPELLKLMDTAPDFYFDSVSQIRMDRWSRGRVILLGDAGYCASPMSGMGTSMAVIGAYVLAGELNAANGNHTVAFNNYETEMRPLVTACQKLAEGADWFVPRTRFKLWLSRQMWKILPYTPWKNLMIEMPLKASNKIKLKSYN